jgi:hypothetical protein
VGMAAAAQKNRERKTVWLGEEEGGRREEAG